MPSPEFETAAADVKNLKAKPSDTELLEIYGLFKQATTGDNTTEKPGVYYFKEKYKWQAWADHKGTSQADAEVKYIKLVELLKQKHGF